jgi:hypothetical protein
MRGHKHTIIDCRILSVVGLEGIYVLPSTHRDQFEALFTALQTRQEELHVSTFGLSVTTMEEVFLTYVNMYDVFATNAIIVASVD